MITINDNISYFGLNFTRKSTLVFIFHILLNFKESEVTPYNNGEKILSDFAKSSIGSPGKSCIKTIPIFEDEKQKSCEEYLQALRGHP